MIHIDIYRASAVDQGPFPLVGRQSDPTEFSPAVVRENTPYWNGYFYYTLPHEDGECATHDPSTIT